MTTSSAAPSKLIKVTGDHAAPRPWMSRAAACGLIATILLYRGIAKER